MAGDGLDAVKVCRVRNGASGEGEAKAGAARATGARLAARCTQMVK